MAIVEQHRSPDGALSLDVFLDSDGWRIEFQEGFAHAHGDSLSWDGYSGSPEEATRAFVGDILASRRPLVMWWFEGNVRDMDWPAEVDVAQLNADLAKYGFPGETWEARYWDGRSAT